VNDNIKRWKQIHGRILKTRIQGQDYIYRTLTVGECSRVQAFLRAGKTPDAEDVAFTAILAPDHCDPDTLPAPLASKLAEFVIKASKVFEPESLKTLILAARDNANQFLKDDLAQWKLMIMRLFPGYTLSALNALSVDEFFDLLLLAEHVSGQPVIDYKALNQEAAHKQQDTRTEEDTSRFGIKKIAPGEVPPKDKPYIDLKGEVVLPKGAKFMDQSKLNDMAANEASDNLRRLMEQARRR